MQPQTKYAKRGGVHIAYQDVGDGPFDLVFVPGPISHVAMVEIADQHWGEGMAFDFAAPSIAGDEHMRRSGLRFADRGVYALRGVPDEWRLFAVEESSPR